MDEAVSFKYGEPRNHRLLGAVTEVTTNLPFGIVLSVNWKQRLHSSVAVVDCLFQQPTEHKVAYSIVYKL